MKWPRSLKRFHRFSPRFNRAGEIAMQPDHFGQWVKFDAIKQSFRALTNYIQKQEAEIERLKAEIANLNSEEDLL